MKYSHISAPIVVREIKDEKTGLTSVVREVQKPGVTLRKHSDRRMRLTMERITHGLSRGARRRKELADARSALSPG